MGAAGKTGPKRAINVPSFCVKKSNLYTGCVLVSLQCLPSACLCHSLIRPARTLLPRCNENEVIKSIKL